MVKSAILLIIFVYSQLVFLSSGSAHKLMHLDDLIAELSTEINEMKADVVDREDKLAELFKMTSRIVSEFDSETESMIEKLRKTCDEQVGVLILFL